MRVSNSICLILCGLILGCSTSRQGVGRKILQEEEVKKPAPAQPTARRRRSVRVVSPEVHFDRRVTFRLHAPRAERVSMGLQTIPGLKPMTRDERGVWTVTLGPAEPGIYNYHFSVDGFKTIDPANYWIKVALRPTESLVEIPGDEPVFSEEQNVPHGVVHIHRYTSMALDVYRGVYIYTPPGYYENENSRYPVLYLLHGSGDNEQGWTAVGRANLIADNLIATGKAVPMIIVMPYGHGHVPDVPGVPEPGRRADSIERFEQNLLNDVIPLVENNYRTITDARHRALAGLSMGGGQTLSIGLKRLHLFTWLGAFSSGIREHELRGKFDKLLADSEAVNDRLNLFWIGCGTRDFLFQANQQFINYLQDKKVEHVAYITEGAHTWIIWRQYLSEFLPLLFKENM